jgi:hypothetical protein
MKSSIANSDFDDVHTYTVLHIFAQVLFWAGNQGNHQNVDPSVLPYKSGLIFEGMNQKKLFFSKKVKMAKIACFRAYIGQPDDHIGWAILMPLASI